MARAAVSPQAPYQRIRQHLLAPIQSGAWPPGHRLPSESELVARFGVARMTVGRALRELQNEGHITRAAGVGSFVAEPRPQSTLLQIASIASEIRERGHEHRCEVLVQRRERAEPEVAHALGLRAGASVFHARCLHHENGVPVQLEERWVNPKAAPQFLKQDFGVLTPSEYLVRHVAFDEIEHVVDAVRPTSEQARLLAMAADDPCLLLTRRTWHQGTPVTWVRCLHPGARYRLGSRFTPRGKPGTD